MKSILFNAYDVKAILDGKKTVTRQVVKQAHLVLDSEYHKEHPEVPGSVLIKKLCKPPYQPGEIIYIRETFAKMDCNECDNIDCDEERPTRLHGYCYKYRADGELSEYRLKWQSPVVMPKEAARIWLKVVDVRSERLQDITEDDVVAEGAEPLIECPKEHAIIEADGTTGDMCWNTGSCSHCDFIEKSYEEMFGEYVWDLTVKKSDLDRYGWKANPWVWVIAFERCEKPEGEVQA